MTTRVVQGFIATSYTGEDLNMIEMAYGHGDQPEFWTGAYLDYTDGKRISAGRERVAFIPAPPPHPQPYKIWLRVNGVGELVGTVRVV